MKHKTKKITASAMNCFSDSQREHERRPARRTRRVCFCCCCSMRQCCYFIIAFITISLILLLLVGSYWMVLDMRSVMAKMGIELKEEREKRKELEEIRLKENQLQEAVQHCSGHQAGERNSFTGIRLLWGILEIGYGNKQQMKSCITEYNDRLSRKMYLN